MADKKLNIKVGTTGAGKAKQQLGGLSGSISKMGKMVGFASAAYFGARGLINGFKFAVKAAGEQEQAEKKLSTALGRTSNALLKQASALQQVTTFGDEVIIGVQASLAAFIKNEEQIKKATVATLDMAVAMGMDLKAAGDLVAKTLGSSTNAMSRYGIQVEGAVGSTERLESLTNNVAELFGGQASAQAETMAGQIEQMKNTIGDTAETLGEVFGPAIIASVELIGDLSEKIDSIITTSGDFIMKLFGIEKATKPASEQVKDFSQAQKKLAEETSKANKQIALQKEMNALVVASNRAITESITDVALALEIEKMELLGLRGGFDELDIELAKLGFGEGDLIPPEVLDNLNQLLVIRKDVVALREGEREREEDYNLLLANSFATFEEGSLEQAEILKAQEKNRKDFLALYPEEAKLLGLITNEKEKQLIQDVKNAALQQGSAIDAMKAVVRAEAMEATAGYIASVLKTVPYPFNLILAAAGGATVAALLDSAMSKFATGGDFITSGPQAIMVGDNPGGQERVQVTPLSSPNQNGPQGGITLNISAPLIDEHILDVILPKIKEAHRMNLA